MKAKWTYDNGCGYLRLSRRKVAETVELIAGEVMVDLDRDGGIVGVEIIRPAEHSWVTTTSASGAATPTTLTMFQRSFVGRHLRSWRAS